MFKFGLGRQGPHPVLLHAEQKIHILCKGYGYNYCTHDICYSSMVNYIKNANIVYVKPLITIRHGQNLELDFIANSMIRKKKAEMANCLSVSPCRTLDRHEIRDTRLRLSTRSNCLPIPLIYECQTKVVYLFIQADNRLKIHNLLSNLLAYAKNENY